MGDVGHSLPLEFSVCVRQAILENFRCLCAILDCWFPPKSYIYTPHLPLFHSLFLFSSPHLILTLVLPLPHFSQLPLPPTSKLSIFFMVFSSECCNSEPILEILTSCFFLDKALLHFFFGFEITFYTLIVAFEQYQPLGISSKV